MNPNHSSLPTPLPERRAYCPSCGCTAYFSYAGEQHWPLKVARIAGVDPVVHLWNCEACHTTLSEQELQ
jgi:hypothetical protein